MADSDDPLRPARRLTRRQALFAAGAGALSLAGLAWFGAGRRAPGAFAEESGETKAPARNVPVFYTDTYVGAAHAFETTRKARWVAESLAAAPMSGIALRAHAPLTEAAVAAVHDPAYVAAVRRGEPRALAESQGFPWDPGLWSMVLASNGGAVAAALAALEHGVAGALASGLHHAHRAYGKGFCTFNGLALAARRAQAAGARRVLVLDFDAHCGGGTHELLGADPEIRLLDIAVNGFDAYVPSGANTLDRVGQAHDYLPTITRRLSELDGNVFDLCLYNAGMDPHEHCPTGGLAGIDAGLLAERERRVFRWCVRRRLPVAFVLAGGYLGTHLGIDALVSLHRSTLAAAASALD